MLKTEEIKARKLPHSLDAEQAVLGCVMLDEEAPVTILNELADTDFYTDSHREIFTAMKSIYLRNVPIDYVTLCDELESKGVLDSVGGISYISALTNVVPSAVNFKHYMDIVKKNAILRRLINSGQKIIDKSYEASDSDDVLAFAEAEVYGVAESTDRSNLAPIKDSLVEVMDKFDKLVRDPDALQGLATGFAALDDITNGLQKSDLILLAARPGVGKTSLAMNISEYIAMKGKKSVAIFSLEMPRAQLAQRTLCSLAKVSMDKALKGKLDEKEWRRIMKQMQELGEAKIFVDDSSLNTPAEILSKCRRLQREKGLDFVVIDYLQLMSSGKRSDNRQQEVSEISRNLKVLAKELAVPVLVLSQLSRAVEGRRDHRPILSDLRESGAIEQDADIVMFIYKSEMYSDIGESEQEQGVAEIILAKHRNGRLGTIKLFWDGETTSFRSMDSDANSQSFERSMPKQKPNSKEYDKAHDEDIDYQNIVPPEMSEKDDLKPEDIFDE